MANAIYPKWKEALMNGVALAGLSGNDIKAILVDASDYTYNAAHEFLTDVPAGARVAISPALTGKVISGANFDSADFTWTAVTGDPSENVVLIVDTGVEATSRLVAFYDTGLTNFPVTPNGGDIDFTVNASGWFDL